MTFPERVDLSTTSLNDKQKKELSKLLIDYQDIFSQTLGNPGSAKGVLHNIDIEKSNPVSCAPRRVGVNEKKVIEEHVKDLLENKVIDQSRSPWAAPVSLVGKKGGSKRFCVDYRKLN